MDSLCFPVFFAALRLLQKSKVRFHRINGNAVMLFALIILAPVWLNAQAQKEYTIYGRITDTEQKPLSGTRIVLVRGALPSVEEPLPSGGRTSGGSAQAIDPASIVGGAVAGKDGSFSLTVKGSGSYTIQTTSVGYAMFRRVITLDKQDTVRLPVITMKTAAVKTDAVEVSERAIRAEVKGDTVEYNASQFKTERNAAAEDLVRKMPGIEVESDGTVKAQGETVRRVIVDGKQFFGDDPRTALKNLPADMIERIQVIDQMSEQSRFTGFDDGDRTKTLNIVTKPDRRNGQFGKVYGGYGTDNRYTAGGNVNFFGGDRRVSLIGLSNNINQQNFSVQDILGAMGGGGGMNQQIRMAVGGAMRGGAGAIMSGGGGGSVGSPRDFLVPQSDGISAAHSLGVNFVDKWGDKLDVAASYFANLTDNVSRQNSLRQTIVTGEGPAQRTSEDFSSNTFNINHRFNARLEYNLDSNNSFVLTPNLTFQSNNRTQTSTNATSLGESALLNASNRKNLTESQGFSFNNELLYRHKFDTEGRTITASVRTNWNNNFSEQNNTSFNTFFNDNNGSRIDSILQQVPSLSDGLTLGGNLSYTEPLSATSMLQGSYNVSLTRSESDRKVMDFNRLTGEYSMLNEPLSNLATSYYTTHRPGLTYRWTPMTGASLSIGAEYQYARLDVDQTFPVPLNLARDFHNILPSLNFTMRLGSAPSGGGGRFAFGGAPPGGGGGPAVMMFGMAGGSSMMSGPVGNLRINYRAFTNQPSIRQLQNVVDNSDPVRLYVGNPELRQEMTHNLSANVGLFDMATATSVFAFISASYTADKIVNSSFITSRDTVLKNFSGGAEPIPLGRGAQLTRPVNLDGYWNLRGFGGYNFPWEPAQGFKLNISLNAGLNYQRELALINNAENISNTYGIAPSLGIGSNISENLDFNINARTSYNIVRNSLQSSLDNEYYIHSIFARINWIFWEGFLISADFNYLANVGLVGGFNQNIPLLNIGIGKRFFDGNGELKLSVFDALNQNNSIKRNVTSAYIEDVQTVVLQRYFLLTFSYNLRMVGQQ